MAMTIRDPQESVVDVAIVGAGPYGLSLAAHLHALGVSFRIFGNPMSTWLTQMPKGMRLKSEGFASTLSEPSSTFTLAHYCKEAGLPYADIGLPVPLATFISYGLEFQKRYVPNLECVQVSSISKPHERFRICLENGKVCEACRVVLAVGITHFAYMPPLLSNLPDELVSHSSQHHALDSFKGKAVAVVGAGASALDLAALLREVGASVQLLARTPVIRFHDAPTGAPLTLRQRLQLPRTGIGSGWNVFFYANAPQLFHFLPERTRLEAVRKTLGPAPAWFVKEQVVGRVPFHLGVDVTSADVENGLVTLELTERNGAQSRLTFDHVIAATGYKVDIGRLTFVEQDLLTGIKAFEQTPVLSSTFESSLPGLYFVGISAANSFGPLLRFAFGVEFVARRLSKHLAKSAVRGKTRPRLAPVVSIGEGEDQQTVGKAQLG
jgi:cation diffusion facilitator CzcD-associated flavoprotein CzcO